jgi:SAM-dependent methyltransferase
MTSLLRRLNRHQWGLWQLRTAWLDVRYGGYIGGLRESRFRHSGSAPVQSVPYRVAKTAMAAVCVRADDVLVDVGCGRGRVLNWWLSEGRLNRMIGVELDPEVASEVQKRLARFANVEIIAGDAVELTPAEATICFLFNPFNRVVVKRWHDAILARHAAPRLTVVYVNCHHLEVFRAADAWSIDVLPKHPADYCSIAVLSLNK